MQFSTLLLLWAGVVGAAADADAAADAKDKREAAAKAEAAADPAADHSSHVPHFVPIAAYPKEPEYYLPSYERQPSSYHPEPSYTTPTPVYPAAKYEPPPLYTEPSYPAEPPAYNSQPPSYTPPPPKYNPPHPKYNPAPAPYSPPPPKPYVKEKCTTKEWSSLTELCVPDVGPDCEILDVRVKKVRDPKTECTPSMIPKCKIDPDVKEMRLCNSKVIKRRATLYATLYEQLMVVRCNTHYETKCKKTYDGYPKCYTVPVKNCYDVPHLEKVNMPIRINVAEVKEDCRIERIPTPKTRCWEEEKMLCPSIPELIERDQRLYKCAFNINEPKCQKVKLTIPKEICYPDEKYYPYPPPPPRPYPFKKTN